MIVALKCPMHERHLTGEPIMVRFDGALYWAIDTSEMSCPSWTEINQCQTTWTVEEVKV